MSQENSKNGLDKLFSELTNYKGLIIQVTAFMFHSENLYSESVKNATALHYVVDYSIKIVLFILFFYSCIRIVIAKFIAISDMLEEYKPIRDNVRLFLIGITILIIIGGIILSKISI